jgi:glutathione S-transferase
VPVWEQPDAVRAHNPLTRVPTLVLDDGEVLVESYAILDWLDEQAGPERRLTPASGPERRRVMKSTAVALGALDKAVWALYEPRFRPKEKVHAPWIRHNEAQAMGGFGWLEGLAAKTADGFLCGPKLTQADVTATVALGFAATARPKLGVEEAFPALARLAQRCEALPAFVACKP